jgi:hypothetical protein
MSSVPAGQRGSASGVRATFFNAGTSLSIGIFFSLMIVGLADSLPAEMSTRLQQQGVPSTVADDVAHVPPVGSLFSAFLGYNPIGELLGPSGVLHQPGVNAAVLTGDQFFPLALSRPFHAGLTVVFMTATAMMLLGALTSVASRSPYTSGPRRDE